MWEIKYRPRSLEEVIGQRDTVEKIRGYLGNGGIPHLLFYGPAGVGKTTLALVIARQVLGDALNQTFIELNASDSRGIDSIREKIIRTARYMPIGTLYKICFLDEAEGLTPDAQEALRRPMERYARNVRIIFSCNDPDRIIDPIKSRCAVMEFTPLKPEDIIHRLNQILEIEGKTVDDDKISLIAEECKGDMRNAIIQLEMTAHSNGVSEEDSKVNGLLEHYLKA